MALQPPQPAYILRGHGAQIHSAAFIRSNSRLLTGDADGWVVMWNTGTRRPAAVWKAHSDGAILGLSVWGEEKIITHGKDNTLVVWKLSSEDEVSMSTVLPLDTPPEPRRKPWVLYMLVVNTMNFCSFAQTPVNGSTSELDRQEELLIAVPNTMSSETVDIFHLPTSKRLHTVPHPSSLQGGMIMAMSIFHHPQTKDLTLVCGYESGHTAVSRFTNLNDTWQALYISKAHTQPILSLSISPCVDFYLTSSADANIVKHRVPIAASDEESVSRLDDTPLMVAKTGHAGQQSLKIRKDGKIFATAGWDGRVRVYGLRSMKELAVLKWHQEGCYAVAFAELKSEDVNRGRETGGESEQGLVETKERLSVKEDRVRKAEKGHWLAVGSKDCKVSLWDIY